MQLNTSKLALVTLITSAIALGGCHSSNKSAVNKVKAPEDGELASLTLNKQEQTRKQQLMLIAGLDASLASVYAKDPDATKNILDTAEASQHSQIAKAFPGSVPKQIPFQLQADLSAIQHAMGWQNYEFALGAISDFALEITSMKGESALLIKDFPFSSKWSYDTDANGKNIFDYDRLITQVRFIKEHLDTKLTEDSGITKTIRQSLDAYYDHTDPQGDVPTNIPPLPKVAASNTSSNAANNAGDLVSRLENTFYLDPADATIVAAKANKDAKLKATVETMLNTPKSDLIFNGTNPKDFEFVSPATNNTPGYIQDTWTPEIKARFMRVFGQVMFLYNTPEFAKKFDDGNNMAMLDKSTQGQPGVFNTPMPDSFAQLKADSQKTTENHKLKVILSGSKSGFDYGMAAAQGSTNPVEMTVEEDSLLHSGFGQVPLVAHEFSHTWGYAHDPVNETMLKPNNIPYYIQFIMGYNQDLHALCGDSAQCHASSKTALGAPTLTWGNSNSIQVKYFGFNTF
ncbi:hypothetical protein [Vibrio rarus]|uniref:hypothetical protein n=1 Tax=Vibrio rarus TaxID=413403 RepID=UPI0021C3DF5B|nr:hypothetical protein [Vibrio rarus]